MEHALNHERRAHPRLGPPECDWPACISVRPGGEAQLVDIGEGGAQVETASRLVPGTTVLITHPEAPVGYRGRVVRSAVAAIRSTGLRYRVAIRFELLLTTTRVVAAPASIAFPSPERVRS
jgi:hypothetical protein